MRYTPALVDVSHKTPSLSISILKKMILLFNHELLHLVEAGHDSRFTVIRHHFSGSSEEEQSLFTGILYREVTKSLSRRKSKPFTLIVKRVIAQSTAVALNKPQFIILYRQRVSYCCLPAATGSLRSERLLRLYS